MPDPSYEQTREQIREAIYGVSADEQLAAQVQGGVSANVDTFADQITLSLLSIDGLYNDFQQSIQQAHEGIKERNEQTAGYLDRAHTELDIVTSSEPGNEITSRIDEHTTQLQHNQDHLANEVLNFGSVTDALEALKQALVAKQAQAIGFSQRAASSQTRLRDTATEARRQATDLR